VDSGSRTTDTIHRAWGGQRPRAGNSRAEGPASALMTSTRPDPAPQRYQGPGHERTVGTNARISLHRAQARMQATASLRTLVARPALAGRRPRSLSDAPITKLAFRRSRTGTGRPPRAADQGSPGWQQPGTSRQRHAEVMRYLIKDHDRIAQRMNDVVVRRIFAAGLDLQTALALIGDHRGASEIYHALDELDQAIRDIRDIIFDRSPPGSPRLSHLDARQAAPVRRLSRERYR
jgi:signal transduction histidine kinase